jgi:two-component system LytT family response regulator
MDGCPALRVLIVDDEPLARSNLLSLLARDDELQVVGQCGSGQEALASIPVLRPDIVFLDVQMPECDGFEVLERLDGAPDFSIVFVTAYQEHAVRAFEVGALEYLLKPFDDKRFSQVLERVKTRHRQPAEAQRFIIKSGTTIAVVRLSDIDWIEAADYYSTLHATGKMHMLRRSLSDLEAQLAPHGFARIHRSTIVNLDRVRSLEIREDGEYEVLLQDGERLRLSRGYRKDVMERLAR